MQQSKADVTAVAVGRHRQGATRFLFLVAGLATAAWAALVPDAKARTGLDEGQLGLVLLCLGIGSILAMPTSGMLSTRYGCRRVLMVCGLVMCLMLPALAMASSILPLAIALFVFGAAIGLFDSVMNIQAIIVERDSGQALMSGFHGFYSMGGILGAALASAIMSGGVPAWQTILLLGAVAVGLLIPGLRHSLDHGNPAEGPPFAVPRGVVLFLGILCFIVFLSEGAMLDWSGVLLTQAHGFGVEQSGIGFACFSVAMTIGRLTGDQVVERLGRTWVVIVGGALAASGIVLATLVPSWWVALFGFGLVGLGCSNIVPVLFTAVGRQTTMPQQVAVPAMSTLGYAGVLAGPAGIGFVAHHSSLVIALLMVAVLMAAVAVAGRFLKF